MNPSSDQPGRVGLWAVLLCSVFAGGATLYPGYWQTLEGFTPVFNASAPGAIAAIATAADLWRGAGSVAFLLAQPFLALGVSPTASVRFSFALAFILGGLGVYVWLVRRLGDRPAGLAGGIYVLMPPVLATVYVVGSLSNAMILALIPLALAGLAIYGQERSLVAAAVAVAAIVLMWRTQAGLALLGSIVLLTYALTVERQRLVTLIAAVASIAGILSLIPLWGVHAESPATFADHFVSLHQLLRPVWQVAPSVSGWQDSFPFQIGVTTFVFAVAGGWGLLMLRPGPAGDTRRLLSFSFIAAGVLLVLSLGVSAPIWRLTGAERLLTYPWLVFVLAAPFLAAAAGSLAYSFPALKQPATWSGLVVLVVAASYPYLAPVFTSISAPATPVAVVGENQAVVLHADLKEDKELGRATLTITWQALRPFAGDDNIFFQALTRADAPELIAQADRPPVADRPASGWQPGELFSEHYTLNLPGGSDEPLQYFFGFYDWRTGERRQIDGGLNDKMVFYGQ